MWHTVRDSPAIISSLRKERASFWASVGYKNGGDGKKGWGGSIKYIKNHYDVIVQFDLQTVCIDDGESTLCKNVGFKKIYHLIKILFVLKL